MVLEDNLKFHSTLTLGDIITVWYRGKAHPLRIIEMKPSEKGILLDTDVEVDLDNSLENKRITDEEAAAEEAQSKVESDNGHKLGGYKLSSSSQTLHGKGLSPSPVDAPAPAPVQSAFEASDVTLPSEPEQDAEDIVSIRVRTPAGNTINSRFYRKQPFIHLFEFASVEMKVEKKVLQLSTRFPNRVFTLNEIEPFDVSFFEAGITASQEMFLASLIT
jgi:UBX domain